MWKSATYAVRGRGHVRDDVPCQDKVHEIRQNGVSAIVLADGAGSAKYSHFGAEAVARCMGSLLTECFDSLIENENAAQVREKIISALTQELELLSAELGCECKELASTLLFAAIKDERIFIGHLGDGVIGYVKNGELKVISKPENGERSNITFFVTSENAVQRLKIMKGAAADVSGIVMMSDGSAESLYDKRENLLSPALKRMLEWLSVVREGSLHETVRDSFNGVVVNATMDDCSVAMLARSEEADMLDRFGTDGCADFFGISSKDRRKEKRVKRYMQLIELYGQGLSLKEISARVHLSPKYTKRHLKRLRQIGIIGVAMRAKE